MRLTCPRCGALYEVEDRLIPAAGRDVQCSGCGQIWFHTPPALDAVAESARAPDAAPDPVPDPNSDFEPAPVPRPRRKPDPDVLRILREEAQREAAARRAEHAALESQTDFGFDPPPRRRPQAVHAAPERENPGGPAPPGALATRGAPVAVSAMPGAQLSRRALLPEIDDVSDGLHAPETVARRAFDESGPPEPAADGPARPERDSGAIAGTDTGTDIGTDAGPHSGPAGAAAAREAARGARRFGLGLALGLCGAAAALYAGAPPLARTVPPLAPALTSYVQAVDRGRLWLDRTVRSALPPGAGLGTGAEGSRAPGAVPPSAPKGGGGAPA